MIPGVPILNAIPSSFQQLSYCLSRGTVELKSKRGNFPPFTAGATFVMNSSRTAVVASNLFCTVSSWFRASFNAFVSSPSLMARLNNARRMFVNRSHVASLTMSSLRIRRAILGAVARPDPYSCSVCSDTTQCDTNRMITWRQNRVRRARCFMLFPLCFPNGEFQREAGSMSPNGFTSNPCKLFHWYSARWAATLASPFRPFLVFHQAVFFFRGFAQGRRIVHPILGFVRGAISLPFPLQGHRHRCRQFGVLWGHGPGRWLPLFGPISLRLEI